MSMEQLRAAVRARVLAVTQARTDKDLPLVGLTTAQAAVVLNKSKKTLLNWSSNGKPIQPVRDANGNLCWPVAAIESFLMGEQQ